MVVAELIDYYGSVTIVQTYSSYRGSVPGSGS